MLMYRVWGLAPLLALILLRRAHRQWAHISSTPCRWHRRSRLWGPPPPQQGSTSRPAAAAEVCDPGISAAVTAIPGAVIAGHLDGMIRIYDKEDGEILWSFNSLGDYESVSGTPASGGSFSGSGPSVRNGYMAINSGYGIYNHMPGNALLLFSVE